MRIFISLVFLCFWNPCSDAAESITNTQAVTTFETLFSPNRNFVLGFFTPPSTSTSTPMSAGLYLGIWVSNDTTRQAVWVANREDPIIDSLPSLKINPSGNLVISFSSPYHQEIPITSVTSTSTATNTSAKLLDNGNLVLVEGATGRVLWQSFDHPTDTLLPGMKLRNLTSWLNEEVPYPGPFTLGIDPNGTNQFVIYYRGVVYWKSRLWNRSEYVEGSHMYHPHSIHYRFESDKDGKYFIFTINQTLNDDQPILNWVMTSSGQIGMGGWLMLLTGYGVWWREVEPKSPCDGTIEEDGSVGCRGRAWPKCGDRNGSAFSKDKTTISFNKNEYNSSIALRDCEFTCRSSCACIAYNSANADGTGCLFWHDEVKEQAYMEPYNGDAFIREDRKNLLTTVAKNPDGNDDQPILNWVMTSSGQVGRGGWLMLGSFTAAGFWWREVEPKSPCDGTIEEDGSVGCRGRAWPKCSDRNGSAFSKDKTTIKFNQVEDNSNIALRDCEFTCRSSCACIAYNTTNDDGTGCLFWHDDVKEQAYIGPYDGDAFI